MANDSFPLRKTDMLFVVAVVLLGLTLPSTTARVMAVGGAVVVWIRLRVYRGRDQ
jgi:hypothetical protein